MFTLDPNKNYPRKLESKAVIRFQDCDPLKHLNNAKYFDYFFNAREDQVAEIYQFDPNEYFEHNHTSWVVYNHQIAYMNSAKVSEWVNIFSSIVTYDQSKERLFTWGIKIVRKEIRKQKTELVLKEIFNCRHSNPVTEANQDKIIS